MVMLINYSFSMDEDAGGITKLQRTSQAVSHLLRWFVCCSLVVLHIVHPPPFFRAILVPWHCGAKRAGYEISFGQLTSILKANLLLPDLHAFFARNVRSPGQESSFQVRGYHTHQRDIQYIETMDCS